MTSALVLFAHGARDPDWRIPFQRIQQRVSARCPGVTVELAFLELMPPALDEVLERLVATGHSKITIAPLFMAQGGHLKQDLPRLLAVQRKLVALLPGDRVEQVELEQCLQQIRDGEGGPATFH